MTWIMDDTFIAVQNKAGMLMIFSCAGELVWMQKDDSRDIALTLQPLIALSTPGTLRKEGTVRILSGCSFSLYWLDDVSCLLLTNGRSFHVLEIRAEGATKKPRHSLSYQLLTATSFLDGGCCDSWNYLLWQDRREELAVLDSSLSLDSSNLEVKEATSEQQLADDSHEALQLSDIGEEGRLLVWDIAVQNGVGGEFGPEQAYCNCKSCFAIMSGLTAGFGQLLCLDHPSTRVLTRLTNHMKAHGEACVKVLSSNDCSELRGECCNGSALMFSTTFAGFIPGLLMSRAADWSALCRQHWYSTLCNVMRSLVGISTCLLTHGTCTTGVSALSVVLVLGDSIFKMINGALSVHKGSGEMQQDIAPSCFLAAGFGQSMAVTCSKAVSLGRHSSWPASLLTDSSPPNSSLVSSVHLVKSAWEVLSRSLSDHCEPLYQATESVMDLLSMALSLDASQLPRVTAVANADSLQLPPGQLCTMQVFLEQMRQMRFKQVKSMLHTCWKAFDNAHGESQPGFMIVPKCWPSSEETLRIITSFSRFIACYLANWPILIPRSASKELPSLLEFSFGDTAVVHSKEYKPLLHTDVTRQLQKEQISEEWCAMLGVEWLCAGANFEEAAHLALKLDNWKVALVLAHVADWCHVQCSSFLSRPYDIACHTVLKLLPLQHLFNACNALAQPPVAKPALHARRTHTQRKAVTVTSSDKGAGSTLQVIKLELVKLTGSHGDTSHAYYRPGSELLQFFSGLDASGQSAVHVSLLRHILKCGLKVLGLLPWPVDESFCLPAPPFYLPDGLPIASDNVANSGKVSETEYRGLLRHAVRLCMLVFSARGDLSELTAQMTDSLLAEGSQRSGVPPRRMASSQLDGNNSVDCKELLFQSFCYLCKLLWIGHCRDQLSLSWRTFCAAQAANSNCHDINLAAEEVLRWSNHVLPAINLLSSGSYTEVVQMTLTVVNTLPLTEGIALLFAKYFTPVDESRWPPAILSRLQQLLKRMQYTPAARDDGTACMLSTVFQDCARKQTENSENAGSYQLPAGLAFIADDDLQKSLIQSCTRAEGFNQQLPAEQLPSNCRPDYKQFLEVVLPILCEKSTATSRKDQLSTSQTILEISRQFRGRYSVCQETEDGLAKSWTALQPIFAWLNSVSGKDASRLHNEAGTADSVSTLHVDLPLQFVAIGLLKFHCLTSLRNPLLNKPDPCIDVDEALSDDSRLVAGSASENGLETYEAEALFREAVDAATSRPSLSEASSPQSIATEEDEVVTFLESAADDKREQFTKQSLLTSTSVDKSEDTSSVGSGISHMFSTMHLEAGQLLPGFAVPPSDRVSSTCAADSAATPHDSLTFSLASAESVICQKESGTDTEECRDRADRLLGRSSPAVNGSSISSALSLADSRSIPGASLTTADQNASVHSRSPTMLLSGIASRLEEIPAPAGQAKSSVAGKKSLAILGDKLAPAESDLAEVSIAADRSDLSDLGHQSSSDSSTSALLPGTCTLEDQGPLPASAVEHTDGGSVPLVTRTTQESGQSNQTLPLTQFVLNDESCPAARVSADTQDVLLTHTHGAALDTSITAVDGQQVTPTLLDGAPSIEAQGCTHRSLPRTPNTNQTSVVSMSTDSLVSQGMPSDQGLQDEGLHRRDIPVAPPLQSQLDQLWRMGMLLGLRPSLLTANGHDLLPRTASGSDLGVQTQQFRARHSQPVDVESVRFPAIKPRKKVKRRPVEAKAITDDKDAARLPVTTQPTNVGPKMEFGKRQSRHHPASAWESLLGPTLHGASSEDVAAYEVDLTSQPSPDQLTEHDSVSPRSGDNHPRTQRTEMVQLDRAVLEPIRMSRRRHHHHRIHAWHESVDVPDRDTPRKSTSAQTKKEDARLLPGSVRLHKSRQQTKPKHFGASVQLDPVSGIDYYKAKSAQPCLQLRNAALPDREPTHFGECLPNDVHDDRPEFAFPKAASMTSGHARSKRSRRVNLGLSDDVWTGLRTQQDCRLSPSLIESGFTSVWGETKASNPARRSTRDHQANESPSHQHSASTSPDSVVSSHERHTHGQSADTPLSPTAAASEKLHAVAEDTDGLFAKPSETASSPEPVVLNSSLSSSAEFTTVSTLGKSGMAVAMGDSSVVESPPLSSLRDVVTNTGFVAELACTEQQLTSAVHISCGVQTDGSGSLTARTAPSYSPSEPSEAAPQVLADWPGSRPLSQQALLNMRFGATSYHQPAHSNQEILSQEWKQFLNVVDITAEHIPGGHHADVATDSDGDAGEAVSRDLPGRTHSETNSLPSSPDLQSHKQDASLDQADALEPAYQEPEKPSRWLPASAAGQSRLLSVESQLAAFHEQLQAIEATAKHVEQEYGQAGQVVQTLEHLQKANDPRASIRSEELSTRKVKPSTENSGRSTLPTRQVAAQSSSQRDSDDLPPVASNDSFKPGSSLTALSAQNALVDLPEAADSMLECGSVADHEVSLSATSLEDLNDSSQDRTEMPATADIHSTESKPSHETSDVPEETDRSSPTDSMPPESFEASELLHDNAKPGDEESSSSALCVSLEDLQSEEPQQEAMKTLEHDLSRDQLDTATSLTSSPEESAYDDGEHAESDSALDAFLSETLPSNLVSLVSSSSPITVPQSGVVPTDSAAHTDIGYLGNTQTLSHGDTAFSAGGHFENYNEAAAAWSDRSREHEGPVVHDDRFHEEGVVANRELMESTEDLYSGQTMALEHTPVKASLKKSPQARMADLKRIYLGQPKRPHSKHQLQQQRATGQHLPGRKISKPSQDERIPKLSSVEVRKIFAGPVAPPQASLQPLKRTAREQEELRQWMAKKRDERHAEFTERQKELRSHEHKPFSSSTGPRQPLAQSNLKQVVNASSSRQDREKRIEEAFTLMGDLLSHCGGPGENREGEQVQTGTGQHRFDPLHDHVATSTPARRMERSELPTDLLAADATALGSAVNAGSGEGASQSGSGGSVMSNIDWNYIDQILSSSL